jgi:glycosyltransferase involved in cell wall biosynthesis
MQGHWGSYLKEWRKVESDSQLFRFLHYNPFRMLKTLVRHHFEHLSVQREVQIMKQNRFYLGRTDWDKQLVEQYSPGANYFHCEEAIRSIIVNASKHWQPQEGRMQFVTISSASELKGNGFILKTARLLKQRGVDFVWKVAGRKEIFHKFECYTGIHHEEVNVELLGLIDAPTIVELLSSSTAYVHTAIIDNSPNSLCEAQLMGCPVVTTPVGGIPQLVTEGQTGLFVPYDDPEALASCLIRLSNDVELQRHLSAQEKAMAHHRHDGASIAQRLHEIYDNIIDTYNNK